MNDFPLIETTSNKSAINTCLNAPTCWVTLVAGLIIAAIGTLVLQGLFLPQCAFISAFFSPFASVTASSLLILGGFILSSVSFTILIMNCRKIKDQKLSSGTSSAPDTKEKNIQYSELVNSQIDIDTANILHTHNNNNNNNNNKETSRDIYFEILSNLSPLEIGKCASLSKEWKLYVDNELLWKRFSIEQFNLNSSTKTPEHGWKNYYLTHAGYYWKVWVSGSPTISQLLGHKSQITNLKVNDTIVTTSDKDTLKYWSTDKKQSFNIAGINSLQIIGESVLCTGNHGLCGIVSKNGSRQNLPFPRDLHFDKTQGVEQKDSFDFYFNSYHILIRFIIYSETTIPSDEQFKNVKFVGHSLAIRCFYTFDSYVVTGSSDSLLKLWKNTTGDCLQTFSEHSAPITSCCIYKNEYILSGSKDKTIKYWHIHKAQSIFTFQGHTDEILNLEINAHFLFSSSKDCTIKLWNLLNQTLIATLNCNIDKRGLFQVFGSKLYFAKEKNIIIWDFKNYQQKNSKKNFLNYFRLDRVIAT